MKSRVFTLAAIVVASGVSVCGCTATYPADPPATMTRAVASADDQFSEMTGRFVDEFPQLAPVSATGLGDHRWDDVLDDVSQSSRDRTLAFYHSYLKQLRRIDWADLSKPNQIDAELLRNRLESAVWRQEVLQEWAWNPLLYTSLAGGSVYSLMARDFAPMAERLNNATARLEQLPRFLGQVRSTLDVGRVPRVHAETAARQNGGVKSIIGALIRPNMGVLSSTDKERLETAIGLAEAAVDEQQKWLDDVLVPNAAGEFRIGAQRFDKKLAFTLHSPLNRAEIKRRATTELDRVRADMYAVARIVVDPDATRNPTDEQQQALIEAALEIAYQELPGRDEIVPIARQYLKQTTDFVRAKNIVEVPDDPIEIILMPEFQRGIALAYCDSPGPLDKGQKTFYAVAPLPDDWTDEQVRSFLREYNLLSIQDLTIHEAMPGHYLQLALSNRYPSTLRAMLYSGPFVEGWAVYAERVMIDEGYLDNDPLMRLINLKWYLRVVTNALIDQAIHVDGMERDEAMDLMTRSGFQEEREAAGKWTRAQLSSTQLSTYFVGFQEHADLRAETQRLWGEDFSLRKYHDAVLSFGSPPTQFVRAALLDLPVPRD